MSMENHGGIVSKGKNSLFVHQSSLAILPVEFPSSIPGGTGEKMMTLPYEASLSYFEGFFNMP
jgi:hypothetical protein